VLACAVPRRFAALERVTFADCVLTQSDFLESRLQHVHFHDCDLAALISPPFN
jgi:uncharacterized protein YjbI with pentapeptide repeats